MKKTTKTAAYPNFFSDAAKLYPTEVIYGPYVRKQDKRRIVVIYDGIKRTAKLYAKVKLEIKLGRRLSRQEEVDHKDDNPKNDRFSNLQLLSATKNRQKSVDASTIVRYSRSKVGREASSSRIRGESNHQSKFTNKQILAARKDFAKFSDIERVCSMLGITKKTARSYLSGGFYGSAGGPLFTFSRVGNSHKYTHTNV